MAGIDIRLIYAAAFFVTGQALAWFQLNSQFVWDWWKDKPLLAVALYSIPVGLCFWNGARLVMESIGTLWTARFLAFTASYISFPILTWVFLGESPFTAKTVICSMLAFAIIIIQLFWR